jgi:thiamine kinase-like enzyme
MEIYEVEKILSGTQYEPFIGSLQKIAFKDFVYNDLFKIGNEYLGFFVLKLRKKDTKNFIDSINCIKIAKDIENIINKNIGVIEKENYILTISEWLNGEQPTDNNRDKLPIFFSKLAALNKNNIVGGPYTSMYLDYNYFDNAGELIDREINYHKKYFFENMDIKGIIEILENLKHSITCIINEDMNCGNLLITDDGKYKIIDTEWIIRGINLYQFQHINYFGFDKRNWHNITDEAKECYDAYFETLGVNNVEANEQIRAIELLNVIRENTYLKYRKKDNDKEMEKRIKMVMEKEKYV